MATTAAEITIDGRQLRLTNPDKVLYPATGFTKGQVVHYYQQIAPVMVPHLAGRAVTLKRWVNGVDGQAFFQKQCSPHRPPWVRTARVPARNARGEVEFCVADDAATLVWLANLAAIELHVSLARAARVHQPTSIVFDFDPGPPANAVDCARVAVRLRSICSALGLETFVKASGSKGLHVFIPLNTPVTYDQTHPWALAMADVLISQDPEGVTANMRRDLRPGRVLVDWSQNAPHKTTICVYSLRGKSSPTVSTPLEWIEVEHLVTSNDPDEIAFTPEQALRRVAEQGDLFAPVLSLRQTLPDVSELARLAAS